MGVNRGNLRATRRVIEDQERVLGGVCRRGAGSASAESTERWRINPNVFVEGWDAGDGVGGTRRRQPWRG